MSTSVSPPFGVVSLDVAAGDSEGSNMTSYLNESTNSAEVPIVRATPNMLFYNSILVGGFFPIITIGLTANASVLLISVVNQWRGAGRRHGTNNNDAASTINTYITNLASADLLYIFGGIFWAVVNYNKNGWTFGKLGCHVCYGLEVMTLHASAYIQTVMTIERYMAIMCPMTSFRYRTVSFARKISVVVWLSALCLAVPAIVTRDIKTVEVRHGEKKVICYSTIGKQGSDNYYTAIGCITFIIPSIIMITIYAKMFAYIFETIRNSDDQQNQITRQLRRSSLRAAKVVFFIVAVWVLCFLPFWTHQLLLIHAPYLIPDDQRVIILSTILLSYINSLINPFLYTLMPKYHHICHKR